MESELSDIEDGPAGQPGYNRLRDLIRADIIAGRLPSGSRLKIADLAARYASSGIPVREALQQLQGEGIVTFAPNRGASVRRIDTGFLRNIHEIREVMEPYLVRWFARHRSEQQIEQLEAVQREYDRAAERGDFPAWSAENRRFHAICYGGHYNEEALATASRHSDLIQAIATRYPPTKARALQVCHEHRAIIEALRRQDEEAAARIVAEHVRHAGQHQIERMLVADRTAERQTRSPERWPLPPVDATIDPPLPLAMG